MANLLTPFPRIFISHSTKDNDFGLRLASDLRQIIGDNDAVWFDALGSLQGGDIWWSKIVEELTNRDVFIILLSPDAMTSDWVLHELNMALVEKKRILPLLYKSCNIRADLKTIHYISFLSPKAYEDAFNELLAVLMGNSQLSQQVPTTVPFAETVASSPSPLWTERPFTATHLPTDGSSASQALLPVAQREKPLPSIPVRARLLGGRTIVLALLVLLVVGSGGIWAALYLASHYPHPSATPTATTPVTPPLSPYDPFVMKNGIQFGFDAQHSGFNPYESQLSPATVSTLEQAWTASTGAQIVSLPAVVNGVVYVGSADHNLYAFKAGGCGQPTCSPLWTATTDATIYSSPAVVNGVVYVGSDNETLYAFKADGCGQPMCSPLWTATTASTGGFITSSPAVANGVVYVGSYDHKLYAFKADGCGQPTCSPLWTATTGAVIYSSPAVANGVVYVGSYDRKLYAFKANGCGQPTCSPLWTATTVVFSSPAVANGVVYVGSVNHKLLAFKADGCGQPTCSPLWTATTGAVIFSSPAVANGVVYVGSGDGKLYAFKADGCGQPTCSPLWAATNIGSGGDSSPTVADGVVYVGSADGKLYAFHRK